MKFLYPFKPSRDFFKNKNPNPFSSKICFLHGVLLLTLEIEDALQTRQCSLWPTVRQRGRQKRHSSRQARFGVQQTKHSASNAQNIKALEAIVFSVYYQIVLFSR